MGRRVGTVGWSIAAVVLAGRLVAQPGPVAPEVAEENGVGRVGVYRVRVENWEGGRVAVATRGREGWGAYRVLGRVVWPADRVNPKGYTASKWAQNGCVAATAVNAIHVKVARDEATDRGVIFSVTPGGPRLGAARGQKGGDSSTILTDLEGGTGIFGGGYSPFVGNPVFVERPGGLEPLSEDYVPSDGDVLVCEVRWPVRYPRAIVFENREDGAVRLEYEPGEEREIGRVVKPVSGVGRFPGSVYGGRGRLRADHCGVIEVSTSEAGEVGGFQIIPEGHAHSPEMVYALTSPQWMIVRPLTAGYSWEGVAPLFSGFLAPQYRPDDLAAEDWMQRLLSRCQVQVQRGDMQWDLVPLVSLRPGEALPSAALTALKDVTAIRISLPWRPFGVSDPRDVGLSR